MWMHVIVVTAAFLTAMLSGIIGMGGGMLLLATLFCFLPHSEAIPVHATVQLASNGTRILAFLRDVHWRTIGRFVAGAVPGGALGILILASTGPPETAEPSRAASHSAAVGKSSVRSQVSASVAAGAPASCS